MIPNELKTAIKENNLVLFVGAGLSCKFKNKNSKDDKTIGNWKNLVIKIIEHLENDELKVKNLKPLAENYDPIEMLNLIEKIGSSVRNKALVFAVDFFTLPKDKNDFSLHKKLCKLTKKIVTTNYDNAFEIAENSFRTRTTTLGDKFGFQYLHKPDEFTLLKLHGSITGADKMVLFPSSYKNLYEVKNEDTERILFYLQNLIFNKTILFIGCGMGDFQINNIFKKVQVLLSEYNDKKHYYLNIDKPDSSLNFLEHIPINNHFEIETIIDELLEIKQEAEIEKFADKRQAEEYKKQKEEVEKQIEILEQELAEKEDKIKHNKLYS